jgi:hypothetical protein
MGGDDATTDVAKALEFIRENPSEKPTTAARIYEVSVDTLYSHIHRAKWAAAFTSSRNREK